jgi:hypothetical protein
MSLTALPKDLVQLLALQLPPQDIARLGLTCKSLARALLSLEAEPLWQHVAERELGRTVERSLETWRATVADLCVTWDFESVRLPSPQRSFGAKLLSLLSRPRPLSHVAVIGARGSGKSSLIEKFSKGEVAPGTVFGPRHRALVSYKNVEFALLEGDAATQRARDWAGLAAVIIMADCAAEESLAAAAGLVRLVVKNCKAPLLVFGNKQDLPNAANMMHTSTQLNLHGLRHRRHIQSSCVLTG